MVEAPSNNHGAAMGYSKNFPRRSPPKRCGPRVHLRGSVTTTDYALPITRGLRIKRLS